MELILWRHAEAEEGAPDSSRKLTGKGKKQAQLMAEWLKPRLPEHTRLIVSPATRAQQTATALSNEFETLKEIGPGLPQKRSWLRRAGRVGKGLSWWWAISQRSEKSLPCSCLVRPKAGVCERALCGGSVTSKRDSQRNCCYAQSSRLT